MNIKHENIYIQKGGGGGQLKMRIYRKTKPKEDEDSVVKVLS